ncbi:two-component system, OmpR family, sensor kinase [Acidiphilium sp. MT5]
MTQAGPGRPVWRWRPWPASLAGRTALTLLIGFALVQAIGLGVHTYNQRILNNIEAQREVATRSALIYRRIAQAAPEDQRAVMRAEQKTAWPRRLLLTPEPPFRNSFALPLPARQILRASIIAFPMAKDIRPHGMTLRGAINPPRVMISFHLPDGLWLTVISPFRPTPPWRTPGFATAFIIMFVLGAAMIIWAVLRLTAPVRTLAAAAEQLGRDIGNAPSLPESGPSEIATAAIAFNTMAARIRRFVEDRTFLLTAIGHDLRTPITRLKLRVEFLEDEAVRDKFMADLDELEAMVASTLAFGRDIAASEAMVPVDIATLLRTALDEAADVATDGAECVSFSGPDHLTLRVRPLSLKRALANLIANAINYGGAARVSLRQAQRDMVRIDIEDDGPGIPAAELERVFEPFRRIETSRNRRTGGTGLGLAIARNAVRAHGGDITLANRPGGAGLIASVFLPV